MGHSRLRGLVPKVFTPRRAEAIWPRITGIAEQLIVGFRHRGEADLVVEFALPLSEAVIAQLLGVPVGDRRKFVKLAKVYTWVQERDIA
ncbi:cytochrome P450 [Streptomyces sp. RKAG293]|uniref:cytochrome P450 n=1 Tax=Streptomyces sp. RKAG293 TaxID=2893403 RepID=UPI002033FC8C|nr:cytochrome P450 [Streptomyces sp. RKAG293]MCM2416558.1 cytochrome P450 [Streptomyces sp. RKAG293]